MIRAVIFDMDGLLIDSEPLWQEAELEIFTSLGVPLTHGMSLQTMGLRTDEVVEYWHSRYPWATPGKAIVAENIDKRVMQLIHEKGVAKPGVNTVIQACADAHLPMAIASSSPMELIMAVVDKLGIAQYMTTVHSAHHESHGKPHPAVYISTAQTLSVAPEECLAFEDSGNGVLSAKAAKMKCIAVPEIEHKHDKRIALADIQLDTLEDFELPLLEQL